MIEVGEKVSSVITYTSSGSVLLFGWLISDLSMAIAAAVAILGYLTGLFFQMKHLKIKERELEARLAGNTEEEVT
ncbi:hypothetical protein [Ferribacterium limneticum]|uniref:hypothetical protein n=1 Tax=Ferribacterium limneticum TaxID=76259 RepID=UPI001CF82A2E|nr:hypothetical protein [Ferribacterium limneticum]UCV26791.1 hypothetical protein KI617_10760 [Ferribacterium limneticum]UCV30708.1 hypothetical protein KI608_10760 [Ferribacterium limneticum]